ncbi:MAG TPA: alpha/beta hydrolase [Acidimicrobiia bacterium]|nr:alpha/beta hydrolase [Acidimicrobiia bacterium]
MKTVRVSDGQIISYDLWGSNRENPIILLQGLGMDSRGFGLQRYLLSQNHLCIAIDHRGSPGSPATKEFSLYRLTRDVLRVMENENISAAHVVGCSMGGIVAQILATVYPKRVKSLTLISTSCSQHDWRSELLQEWKQRLMQRRSKVLDHEILMWLIGPRLLRRSTIFLPIAQKLFQEIDVHQFCMQVDAICAFSDTFKNRLSAINVPTQVLVGSQDTLTPVGDAQELCMYIKGAELSIVYGTAHGMIIESPIQVGRLMLDGIERADALNSATYSEIQ